MKKILILAAAVGLSALSSYAQGTVNFANSLATVVTVSNATTHTTSDGGTNSGTVVELFYQPGGGSAPAALLNGGSVTMGSWEAIAGANPFTLTGSNGRFAAGGQTTGTDVGPSGAAWLTVLGWNGGGNLAAAMSNNVPIAESTIFELTTGGGGSPPATAVNLTASTTATGFVAGTAFNSIMTITGSATPEPATIAIGGFGAAALLFLRRRRK